MTYKLLSGTLSLYSLLIILLVSGLEEIERGRYRY